MARIRDIWAVCVVCVFLLLLLATSGALSAKRPAVEDTATATTLAPLDRFEGEIKQFEKQDARRMPQAGCTVFVGSSSFRFWKDLEQEFGEFHAVNRGFGGSTFPDVNHYLERIVTKYKPAKIVLYVGTNDIAELHSSAQQLLREFKEFVRKVRAVQPDPHIYFISMSMAPSRTQWAEVYESGNDLIRKYIQSTRNLHYIDIVPVMRSKDGRLRADLFGPDRLHMNAEGYKLWASVIRKALQQK